MNATEVLRNMSVLISVVNPIGAIPIFIGLTSELSSSERNKTAKIAAFATTVILIISALLGQYILDFFGISLSSFRVGGGILLLLIAISMLHARVSRTKHTPQEAQEAEDLDSIAVVPLAMPIMAGPGSISTVILIAHDVHTLPAWLMLCGIIILIGLSIWLCLEMAVPIGAYLGTTGINVTVRILGLILAAISIEFMATGLKELFPALRG